MTKRTRDSLPEQNDYLKALAELAAKGDEIVDWKVTRSLEEAKLLSINTEFQTRLTRSGTAGKSNHAFRKALLIQARFFTSIPSI